MQRLEVIGAVRPIYGSLGVKRLTFITPFVPTSTLILYLRIFSICSHKHPNSLFAHIQPRNQENVILKLKKYFEMGEFFPLCAPTVHVYA